MDASNPTLSTSSPTHMSLTKMAPKRQPLQDITNFFAPAPKKLKTEDAPITSESSTTNATTTATSSTTTSATNAAESKAVQELRGVSRALAITTLKRLIDGYVDKSGASYPAAITTPRGCILAQKNANRAENGYVQIAPLSNNTRVGTTNGTRSTKPIAQGAHRLAVVAYGSDQDKANMLDQGWHASHRCHQPRCIAPGHITVEAKASNEGRKMCAQEFWVMEVEVGGRTVRLSSDYICRCNPPCIPKMLKGHQVD